LVNEFPKLSETFIAGKFVRLTQLGCDVHIVCSKSDEVNLACFPEIAGDAKLRKRVHVNWPRKRRWLALLLFPFALLHCLALNPVGTLRYLLRGWQAFGPDVIRRFYLDAQLIAARPRLIHFEFGPLAVTRMHLKRLLDCRIVVSFRGYDLNLVGLEENNYYEVVWQEADALHFLGEDLLRQAYKRGCPTDKPVFLIPPAIDTSFFTPDERPGSTERVGTPERPLRVLSVGRLDWRKGYEYGFQALSILKKEGLCIDYQLAGDGDYYEPLMYARQQLRLGDDVQIVGARKREGIRDLMKWADVFLHPAVSEGFCNAVMEAQSMALPVVCTDAGGLPENVVEGETGFVVPRRSPSALADSLRALARNPKLRLEFGKSGRQRVMQHFKIEDQAQKFSSLYAHLTLPGLTSTDAPGGESLKIEQPERPGLEM
jgi:colanic acid/amylovoran biosynthesis glycosyltransferase